MSRLAATFARLREDRMAGLVTYVTAGDPDLARTAGILRALDRAGADVIEVGVPFSDPLADGPVIQRATERALEAGTTLVKVLDLLAGLRASLRPAIVIFSYATPILRLGAERFADRARDAGVDGVLVLDLPIEEADDFRALMASRAIDTILLVSPTTTDHRLQRAAALGSGFLYAISRLGVTGIRDQVADGAEDEIKQLDECQEGDQHAGHVERKRQAVGCPACGGVDYVDVQLLDVDLGGAQRLGLLQLGQQHF